MAHTAIATDGPAPGAPPQGRAITISPSATRRIAALRQVEGNPNLMLRITVSGGGCSGFQYGFSFDDTVNGDDLIFERDGVRAVVDDVSIDLLAGAEIDFIEDLMGSYFQVKNPNAAS